jgi:hypothetical protein
VCFVSVVIHVVAIRNGWSPPLIIQYRHWQLASFRDIVQHGRCIEGRDAFFTARVARNGVSKKVDILQLEKIPTAQFVLLCTTLSAADILCGDVTLKQVRLAEAWPTAQGTYIGARGHHLPTGCHPFRGQLQ